MKKSLLCLLSVVVLALGGALSASATNLRMASGAVGTVSYAVASGLAAVYQTHTKETLEVLTKEISASLPELYDGRYEFAAQFNNSGHLIYHNYNLRTGEPTNDKTPSPIRLVMMGNPMPAGFLVLKSSGMTKVTDLKGKRATTRFSQASPHFWSNVNMAAAGLEPGKDFTPIQSTNPPSTAQLLNDGLTDAAFGGITVPAFLELDVAKGVRYLSHDPTPEVEARGRASFPGAMMLRLDPGPGVVGIIEPTYMLANHNVVFSAANIPDDVVYKFVKVIWENRHDLVPFSADLAEWPTLPPASTYAACPFHPGAIRYYKEAGLWSDEMEKWNQQLLDIYK